MKKLFILLPALLVASVCSAQTLDEIINKYYAANGTEILEKASTLYIEGNVSQMGTEMPIIISVKKPNKVKVVISFSGMDIITAFDGEKGFMINPLTGATDPVEIPAEQLGSVQDYNMFRDNLLDNFKAGRVKLEGVEDVNGKPAYKLSVTDEAGTVTGHFIDKESFLTVKTTAKVNQMGQEMEVESFITEYMDINGVKFAKVIKQMVNGMELGGMTFTKVEIDKPLEDSVFKIN
jgi:outer membrane lipoprotein-sorting protein